MRPQQSKDHTESDIVNNESTSTNQDQDEISPRLISSNGAMLESAYISAPPLASSRYNRQLMIPSISLNGQTRIQESKILIIGLGGLGSPAALYLAGAGVHTLGLLDHDIVETSNLHRQIAHRESSVSESLSKVSSALRSCRDLNSSINYVCHETALTGPNALDIIANYDVVLDCTDNPATRYLISDACVLLSKTLVSGAAQKLEGQLMVLNYDRAGLERGPCYRCVFPRPPAPEMVKGCSEIGIVGPVVGAVGTLMASETLRIVVKGSAGRKPSMLLYNAWADDPRHMFRTVGLRGRRADCLACGDEEVIVAKGLSKITADEIREGRLDYGLFCGVVEDVHLLSDEQRVSADQLLSVLRIGPSSARVIDVREEHEVQLGPKIRGSLNIPLTRIMREKGTVKEQHERTAFDALLDEQDVQSFYFVCQQGNDSQIAAKELMERTKLSNQGDTRFIGDIKGGFIALESLVASSG